ncbi:MAG: serine--tRNA ligase, partial [Rhodospirillaceae bacterium]|nr:serine--tRNA ligase [Rhodospirillaceae bacterium]
MFDPKWIRDNPGAFDSGRKRRGLPPLADAVIALDAQRRTAQTAWQEMQAKRNDLSKQIGQLKAKGGDAAAAMAEVATLKEMMATAESEDQQATAELEALLAQQPNLPADDVPEGPDETANRIEREVGHRRNFAFAPKQHFELGEALGLMDFATAAKISGARFVVLKGQLARLERALAQFMLDLHTAEHGYTEVNPPYLVRDAALYGTGQLPKFAEDLFRTEQGHYLIPTAEVPLTNLVADEIVDEAKLPLRFAALTPCFRSEAGAAGRDTRGMIRQHQFMKVEMVSIAHPDESDAELQRMTGCAEKVLQRLDLPYRVLTLSTG